MSSKLTASDKESTETSKQTAGATGATAATLVKQAQVKAKTTQNSY